MKFSMMALSALLCSALTGYAQGNEKQDVGKINGS
jgi:hypothetical protein